MVVQYYYKAPTISTTLIPLQKVRLASSLTGFFILAMWFCKIVNCDRRNLVHSFMHVTSETRRLPALDWICDHCNIHPLGIKSHCINNRQILHNRRTRGQLNDHPTLSIYKPIALRLCVKVLRWNLEEGRIGLYQKARTCVT